MANGNFEDHVAAVVHAGKAPKPGYSWPGGLDEAHFVFARMCHEGRWTAGYASRVWDTARSDLSAGKPSGGQEYDDDIPF
jgi:hypothetical protein